MKRKFQVLTLKNKHYEKIKTILGADGGRTAV